MGHVQCFEEHGLVLVMTVAYLYIHVNPISSAHTSFPLAHDL